MDQLPRGRSMRATAAVPDLPIESQPFPICPVGEYHPIPVEQRRRRDQLVPMRTTGEAQPHLERVPLRLVYRVFPAGRSRRPAGYRGLGSWMAAPACLIACLAALLILIARLKLCADEDRADVMPHRPR